ncbi:hypothetical protein LOTGIDRAFT_233608 [Lottia gigantea]|uniref:Uncharacterized protein n=1 Tax=Lottia gigantea TaxID=225164 RepID=V4A2F3_LOTGI|nr:hypothetical protein LOTGIDRAFT_233608 [Lottia gigantea]ESO90842.1 hypothetical protein LOTGIDRAFT_233608 [Lottia gigantea]
MGLKVILICTSVLILVISADTRNTEEEWLEFAKTYDMIKRDTFLIYHMQMYKAPCFNGKICADEQKTKFVGLKTGMLLLTPESSPYWFQTLSKSNTITIYHYLKGGPTKITSLYKNGTRIVSYLGDKMDPQCKYLNCQVEVVVDSGLELKEVANVSGWTAFFFIDLVPPLRPGQTESYRLILEEDLVCKP